MPSWSEILVLLPFFSGTSAVLGLIITSAVLVLLQDWRLLIFVLLVQYAFANILLINFLPAEIALFKFIVGAMICLFLFTSVRRAVKETAPSRYTRWKGGVRVWAHRDVLGLWFPFRLLTVLLIGVVVYVFTQRFPLQGIPLHVNFAIYWLAFMGLLVVMLTVRPLKVGLGLLTFLIAFELYYVTIERGLVVTGLLGVLHLMVALATAYLIIAQAGLVSEETAEE